MRNHEPLNAADRELEAALAGLQPAHVAIDRDRLMFQAGRASVQPKGRGLWPVLSAGLAAALVLSVATRPDPAQTQRLAADLAPSVLLAPSAAAEATPDPSGDYVTLRREVLQKGLAALPDPPAAPVADRHADLETLLGPPPQNRTGRWPWESNILDKLIGDPS